MPLALSEHHTAAAGAAATCCDLLCSEDANELDSGGGAAPPWRAAEFQDDSDESIAGFIEGAADYSPGRDYPDRFRSDSPYSAARRDAVAWILKVHAYYRFRPLTAYLAVNYMDRFLSSHRLPQNEWALQLLSVACISLAAKMEETLLPSLLDLQVQGAKFIFEPRTILRMELLVLNALNWRLRSVTPFTFIDFFVNKIDPVGKHAHYLVSWATEITLATMKDARFLSHCPSSLAAAAIICATDEIKELAFVNPSVAASWCMGLTEEGITSCYQSMQQVMANCMRRKHQHLMMLPQLISAAPIDPGSRASSSSSSPPSKRRKLNNNSAGVDNGKEWL